MKYIETLLGQWIKYILSTTNGIFKDVITYMNVK